MRKWMCAIASLGLVVAACSSEDGSSPTVPAGSGSPTTTSVIADTTQPPEEDLEPLLAGAASRSVLPTVDGTRDYLADAPGWDALDPNDIGVFVPKWDQGRVDVGNGNEDGSWVHDDLRTTAVALTRGGTTIVFATADVYMIFAADSAEIERRARRQLTSFAPEALHIVISATHNHHGPDTAFSVNDQWYELLADQMVEAIVEAAGNMEPAVITVAAGTHRFGQSDGRDPIIVDPRLNLLHIASAATPARTIANIVQWGSHPETTLNWDPPGDYSAPCAVKAWAADDCTANGRYFTADYPGILRERLSAEQGGEVLYLNGAIGSQIGPGDADVWQVDAAHPEGDGITPPAGAQAVAGATDLRSRNLARTEAIGAQLTAAVTELLAAARPLDVPSLTWQQQPYYTRLTNIGFRVLLADGDLGWKTPTAYTCAAKPFTDATCTDDGGASIDDPVLTPLVDSQIRAGDVLKTQLTWVQMGDVGFLFMPGELPPELVIGLPADFVTNTAKYYQQPALHATGADYAIPGFLLDLVPTAITFTVGLGGDELGYWVPINEARLKCLDLVFAAGSDYTCQRLYDEGLLITPDAVAGPACRELQDAPALPTDAAHVALLAVCRYGQALGRELGEPDGHYEETNSAGWDLVDDTWVAAQHLFSS